MVWIPYSRWHKEMRHEEWYGFLILGFIKRSFSYEQIVDLSLYCIMI